MTYIILKNCDPKKALAGVALSIPTPQERIREVNYIFFKNGKRASKLPPITSRKDMAIEQFTKNVRGLTSAQILALNGEIKTDKYLISTFGDMYVGIVGEKNYSLVEQFATLKILQIFVKNKIKNSFDQKLKIAPNENDLYFPVLPEKLIQVEKLLKGMPKKLLIRNF